MRTTALLLVAAAFSMPVAAQSGGDDEGARGLGDLGFIRLRPAPKKPAPARKKPAYKPAATSSAKPATTPAPGASSTLVGVTLWRMRPAQKTDTGTAARLLVQEEVTTTDDGVWTPERVDLDTPLAEGQHVRFAIETPRAGYLYVVDREIYEDGTSSPAYAIFPTTRTRGGDNKVAAGAVVEIPALSDDRAYFTVKRSRQDQVAEEFTVIVSPTPLDGVAIARTPAKLTAEQLDGWRKQWGGPSERVDLVEGVGQVYTPEEKAGTTAALTQDDPAPQTIFRVTGKAGDPALVSFRLKYR